MSNGPQEIFMKKLWGQMSGCTNIKLVPFMRICHHLPGFHPGSQAVYSARRVSARRFSRQCSRRRIRAECWWPAWRRGQSSSWTASESPVSPQSLVLSIPGDTEIFKLLIKSKDHQLPEVRFVEAILDLPASFRGSTSFYFKY